MKEKGKIILRREEWFNNPTLLYFWVNILFMASENDGSFTTSLYTLARDLHLSVRQVRTCISRIESDKRATHEATKQGTKITICDYDSYKDVRHTERQTLRHTSDTPSDTRKEVPPSPPDGFSPNPSSLTPYNPPQEKKESSATDVPEDEKRDKPVSAPSDFGFVLKLWNDSASRSIPKVRMLSPARKEKVRLRIKEMGGMEEAKTILATCFKKISESDFCNGSTGKWVATFDWFFENEKNWLKVYEGNYDNRKPQSRIQQYADTANRFNALMDELYGPDDNGTANGAGYTPDEQ